MRFRYTYFGDVFGSDASGEAFIEEAREKKESLEECVYRIHEELYREEDELEYGEYQAPSEAQVDDWVDQLLEDYAEDWAQELYNQVEHLPAWERKSFARFLIKELQRLFDLDD